ncbi:MAG: type II secretion system F family protein [Planctomycetota bacterium]
MSQQTLVIVAFVMTFVIVTIIGLIILLVRTVGRKRIVERLDSEVAAGPAEAVEEESVLVRLVALAGFASRAEKASESLRSKLTQAGYYGRNAAAVFMGSKILLLVIMLVALPIGLFQIDMRPAARILMILMGAMMAFIIPDMVLSSRRKARSKDIHRHLPDAVDLLEVSVSAGMGLSAAWNMVTDEITQVSRILADEMALTNLEIHLGLPRNAAMTNLSDRTGVREIGMLSSVLVQSERFGTDVAEALRAFAESMRQERSTQAEEEAEKTAVRLIFPMVLFIFPAIFVVAVGPAAMTLVEMMFK